MNTQQDNQIAGMDAVSEQAASVGKVLREARELLGLSVSDVANRIKFAPRQIESLEAGDYENLPEAAFVRGFVRSYARLLEIDSAPLLASLPSSHMHAASGHETRSVEIPMPTALSARRYNIILLSAGLVIALSVAVFMRAQDSSPSKSKEVLVEKTIEQPVVLPNVAAEGPAPQLPDEPKAAEPQDVQAEKVPAPPKPEPREVKQVTSAEVAPQQAVSQKSVVPAQAPLASKPSSQQAPRAVATSSINAGVTPASEVQPKNNDNAVATEHALRLEFDEDAWLEVKDGNNKILISKMHTAGSLVRVTGKSPLLVIIGNAPAVRLFDNGKKVNLGRYTTAEVARVKLN